MPYKQGAVGSNPSAPTSVYKGFVELVKLSVRDLRGKLRGLLANSNKPHITKRMINSDMYYITKVKHNSNTCNITKMNYNSNDHIIT